MSDLLAQLRESVALIGRPSTVCEGCGWKSNPSPPAPPRCTSIHPAAHFAKECGKVDACRFSPLARRKISP